MSLPECYLERHFASGSSNLALKRPFPLPPFSLFWIWTMRKWRTIPKNGNWICPIDGRLKQIDPNKFRWLPFNLNVLFITLSPQLPLICPKAHLFYVWLLWPTIPGEFPQQNPAFPHKYVAWLQPKIPIPFWPSMIEHLWSLRSFRWWRPSPPHYNCILLPCNFGIVNWS